MIKEARKFNVDDFIKQGYAIGPDKIDPTTGKVTNDVYNLKDFNKDIHKLYEIYQNMTKFKGASNENIKILASKICKDIPQTVRDIKELQAYIELVKQRLTENK